MCAASVFQEVRLKVLVFGGTGMLGHKVVEVALKKGLEVGVTIRKTLAALPDWYREALDQASVFENIDVASLDDVERTICRFEPTLVVNCVGIIKQIKE